MTTSMDTRPMLTAKDMGLAVGDRVRFDDHEPDWCKTSGVWGTITDEPDAHSWMGGKAAFSSPNQPRTQLITVTADESEHRRAPIHTSVTSVTKVRPTIQYSWTIGPEDEATQMEINAEVRREDMWTAHMLGFKSPDDPGFKEAEEEYAKQYDVKNEFPTGERVLVYSYRLGSKIVGAGTVAAHKQGLTEDGDAESGPQEPYLTDLIVVLMDDGKVRWETEGTVDNRKCENCGGLIEAHDAHTGIEATTFYNCRNCDWKDLA